MKSREHGESGAQADTPHAEGAVIDIGVMRIGRAPVERHPTICQNVVLGAVLWSSDVSSLLAAMSQPPPFHYIRAGGFVRKMDRLPTPRVKSLAPAFSNGWAARFLLF